MNGGFSSKVNLKNVDPSKTRWESNQISLRNIVLVQLPCSPYCMQQQDLGCESLTGGKSEEGAVKNMMDSFSTMRI
jgi:hypothetical protein